MINLPEKLKIKLADNATCLLAKITDEPISNELSKTEKDFFEIIFTLRKLPFAFSCLAEVYMKIYYSIRKEKIQNPEFIERIKKEYPIDWEKFNWE